MMATAKRAMRKAVRVANKNKVARKKNPVAKRKVFKLEKPDVVEPRPRDPLYPEENGAYIRIADPPRNCRSRYISIRAVGFGASENRNTAKAQSKAQCDAEMNAAIAEAEDVECEGNCSAGKTCEKIRLALRGFGGPSYRVRRNRDTGIYTIRCRRYRSFRLLCRCE